ncbi:MULTISPECIES: hypothetical protein [unclassified Treponema]|uniref:hypothetical protein n=1 Tax=unclassified Treponema TaxID=2638727 RepID=UPI0020A335EB|nr:MULTISPECIES: hypothetical protein [unclassified Treponema]UTC66347.1 hypothetical protein E4O06_10245 [Treponema sp. OMZ 789]UTC69077.1 hypothetical protein E4O01_10390 [Treponema sp. OMZ 790]UTC71789.1 hypothetical protein E4O02_10480 [Treponema sp. OMZ 791]
MENKQEKDKIVKFFTLKLWIRISALIVGGAIFYLNISSMKDGQYSIIALIFGALFLAAALFENSWYFNITKKQAIQKAGIFFFPKTKIINFSEIHAIEIETFKRPARFGTFTEVKMILLDGKTIVIDNDKTKFLQRQLEELAEVQDAIRHQNDKKAEDFFNAVAADILNPKE